MACFCVLQVEDDDNDIYFLKFALQRAPVTDCLRVVKSGEEALEYFQGLGKYADRKKHPIPGLVLLDLRMPRMNGLEVLKWIRAQPDFHAVVVIMFTSSAHPDDIGRASQLGANAFVQKPSGPDELVRFLQSVKTFWCEFHQFPPALERLFDGVPKPDLQP
jgi:CheY-like chemotaxis protein